MANILEIPSDFRGDPVTSDHDGIIKQVQTLINELNFDKLFFRRKWWFAGKNIQKYPNGIFE